MKQVIQDLVKENADLNNESQYQLRSKIKVMNFFASAVDTPASHTSRGIMCTFGMYIGSAHTWVKFNIIIMHTDKVGIVLFVQVCGPTPL